MLELIDFCKGEFWQVLVKSKEKVWRLSQNIHAKSFSVNHNNHCGLELYTRTNAVHDVYVYEAGIVYGPGLNCDQRETFPMEMLRVFSYKERTPFVVAKIYYTSLVEEQCFDYFQ